MDGLRHMSKDTSQKGLHPDAKERKRVGLRGWIET